MAIIVIVCVFFMQIFRLTILGFSSRTFFDLSDLFMLSFFIFKWLIALERSSWQLL